LPTRIYAFERVPHSHRWAGAAQREIVRLTGTRIWARSRWCDWLRQRKPGYVARLRQAMARERAKVKKNTKSFTVGEYERMAAEMETLAATIRMHPEMNNHFAERLALIAKQMREDMVRLFPETAKSSRKK
jgi:hypothetical protein